MTEYKNITIGELPLGHITKVKIQLSTSPNGTRFFNIRKFRLVYGNWIPIGSKSAGTTVNLDNFDNRQKLIVILKDLIDRLERMENHE